MKCSRHSRFCLFLNNYPLFLQNVLLTKKLYMYLLYAVQIALNSFFLHVSLQCGQFHSCYQKYLITLTISWSPTKTRKFIGILAFLPWFFDRALLSPKSLRTRPFCHLVHLRQDLFSLFEDKVGTMGRIFLEHMGGSRLFSCATCDTNLTNRSELISTRFTGATGRAFLFNKVVNLIYSDVQDRVMLTGRHMVSIQRKLGNTENAFFP